MSATRYDCLACKATGLYCGFMEGKGQANVCNVCKGSGASSWGRDVFTRRKSRDGVTHVRRASSLFFANEVTERTQWMTLEQFKQQVPEEM